VEGTGAGHRAAGEQVDGFPAVIPVCEGFDALYGLELVGPQRGEDGWALGTDGTVCGRVRVRPELLGAEGRLHGGVPAAIAESLASHGTAFEVLPGGMIASGLSNDTTMVAPVAEGATLHAKATVHSRGEDYWVWSVQLRDDAGALCAFSRITIAVRPQRR